MASEDQDGVGTRRRLGVGWPSRIVLAAGLLLLAIFIAAWLARRPIAEHFIERELEKRGVEASYTIEKLGLRDQLLRNVVIGDPDDPDLTADYALVQMRLSLSGIVKVYRIVAKGVRLEGRLGEDGKVSWGQLDKLLPEPSGKPFRLPDLSVAVSDAQIALNTPYGPMGFTVSGNGNLTGGFAGKLAAAAPALIFGSCRLGGMKAALDLAVTARRPAVKGPVSADLYACSQTRLSIAEPRLVIDSDFSEGFDTFDGQGRLSAASLRAGNNGLANLSAMIGFEGSADDAEGRVQLAARRARLGAILADGTRLDGQYRIWPKEGRLQVKAAYQARDAALENRLLSQFTGPLEALGDTPAGPATKAIAAAIRRTGRAFDAAGELILVNSKAGGGVRILSAEISGPGGATINLAGGEGATYYFDTDRLRIDGRIALGGGGLPRADIDLSQPRGRAPMSGEARIQPYATAGSRLALAPVRFRGMADGSVRVSTSAIVDGPVSGARIEGLRLPVAGRIGGPSGGFAIGEGCIDMRFTRLQAGTLRLGRARLPICPSGGAIVAKRGRGPVAIDANVRNLKLDGNIGSAPLSVGASRFAFRGQDRFTGDSLAIRIGNPDAPVAFHARQFDGRLVDGGAAGSFVGSDVIVGRVPVALEDAAGRWRFIDSKLAINGGATLFDRAEDKRFYDLRTDDLAFRLDGNDITTTGTLYHPATKDEIVDVIIDHDLGTGNGRAALYAKGIDFSPGALQPDMLTPAAAGAVALVDGRVTGEGLIRWDAQGNVTSSGEFTTQDMDLAASFGPVTGLSTTIRFTDLLGLETAPGQTLTVATVNPGILAENGVVRYQLLPGQLVKVERGEWPFMGGRLILEETILNLAKDSPKRLTFTVVGLDAKTFVDTLQFDEIEATGIFDGVLPMIFDETGGRIVGGRLDSRPGGGTLSYTGAVSRADLGFFAEMAFDALRSLRFESMIIRLDGDLAGEFATRLTIDEVGLGNDTNTQRLVKSLVRNVQFKFNVTITGPFRALIATAKSFRDPRNVINDVMPVPLDEVPGIVTEVRRMEEQSEQDQTPVEQDIDLARTTEEK